MPRRKSPRFTPNAWTEHLLIGEIERRCRDAWIASQLLNQAFASPAGVDADLCWFALRSILIAAAAISQFVGRERGALATERTHLRSILGIDARSILHDRRIRDYSEHFDTRILRMYGPGSTLLSVSYVVADHRLIKLPQALDSAKRGLWFDNVTGILSLFDAEISIPDVLREIGRVYLLAQAARQQPPDISGLQGQGGSPITGATSNPSA